MIPALGYIRVSSVQQAGETHTSLDDQRAAITALAERAGAHVVRVFADPGVSGATIAKRPGLVELMAYCDKHKRRPIEPGYVFILNDSRLGRFDDPDEAAHLRFTLKNLGWIVRFAEADDIADPSLRHIMRAVGSAQASEYRRNLRANTTRGRIGTTKLGFWATKAPYGYARMVVAPAGRERVLPPGVPKAKDEKIKLTPGPAFEVQVVQDIFAMYATGAYSLHGILRWVKLQVPTSDARVIKWNLPGLKTMLENYTYLGCIPGRRRTAARMEVGDWARRDPEYIVDNTHPALIDRDTFDRVQHILGQMPARGLVADYRVRGLIKCSSCGEPFVGGGLATKHRLVDGERVRFYVDRGARDGQCPKPMTCISKHLLERVVINGLAAHVAGQITEAGIRSAFKERMAVTAAQPTPHAQLDRALTQARTRFDNLIAAVETGALRQAEVEPRLSKVRAEIERLELQLASLPGSNATPATVLSQLELMVSRARDLVSLAKTATGPELRALLLPWMDSMIFDRSTRILTMRMRTLPALLLPTTPVVAGSP